MYYDVSKTALLGKAGEQFVADYLKSKGYIIIKRNWRDSRYGEIDIVAENHENIVFVEVKTRQPNALVSGIEAVDTKKQRRIKNASQMFMKRLRTTLPPRLDVAEVTLLSENDGKFEFQINYIKNAF
ncbi:MAG: YraN family protein [Acutalibacteraceae bacterium]